MTDTVTSTASVTTDRAARYGKQLVSHLGRRAVAHWADEAQTGTLDMAEGAAKATITASEAALLLSVTTTPDRVAAIEDVIGRHLVRFGRRDELVVAWTRSDGTEGSQQVNTDGD